jgi:hypothetical protein
MIDSTAVKKMTLTSCDDESRVGSLRRPPMPLPISDSPSFVVVTQC